MYGIWNLRIKVGIAVVQRLKQVLLLMDHCEKCHEFPNIANFDTL